MTCRYHWSISTPPAGTAGHVFPFPPVFGYGDDCRNACAGWCGVRIDFYFVYISDLTLGIIIQYLYGFWWWGSKRVHLWWSPYTATMSHDEKANHLTRLAREFVISYGWLQEKLAYNNLVLTVQPMKLLGTLPEGQSYLGKVGSELHKHS